jgi:tetratricopeptide (TPR) repeat protein
VSIDNLCLYIDSQQSNGDCPNFRVNENGIVLSSAKTVPIYTKFSTAPVMRQISRIIIVNKHYFFLATGIWLVAVSAGSALDSIKTKNGGILGKIVSASPLSVEIEQGVNADRKEIPVNQIDIIFFNDELGALRNAKNSILNEHYEEALNVLSRLKIDVVTRKELREDIEFYIAFSTAQLAIGGSGKIPDAGRLMIAFIKNYPDSYHYFQACEIVGDLLVANRSFAQAEEYYAKLAKAPWPDYQMRAGVAIGRALLAQGKISEALNAFEKVIADDKNDALSQAQYQAAKMGKASVLVAMKKNDEAVKLIQSVLNQANPDDTGVMARAYNILGNALRQEGKKKEAVLAFLHVDLLYSFSADSHAEALWNLAELWDELHKTDRAARARQVLEQQYKSSPWAQKGGQ